MPIYEYRCPACGGQIEKIQRQPLAEVPCPVCGDSARRIVSKPATGGTINSSCGSPAGSGFT